MLIQKQLNKIKVGETVEVCKVRDVGILRWGN